MNTPEYYIVLTLPVLFAIKMMLLSVYTHTHIYCHELKLVLKVLTEKLLNRDLHMGLQQLFTMYCLFVTKHL